ncbi:MAG: 3-methyl-2-oxobutanoate hydroxymethyltransferase [Planctomycetota bacterium]|jgi:3-methyl-2-oxobutanoate hydroxymethyltransferase
MASRQKITINTLRARKREKGKFAMLTCYDFTTATLMEEAGIETLLVGDTYAEVILGHPTTLPVTTEHLVTIAEAVRRGAPSCYLIGDMPYLSYQVTPEEAIRNAGKFMARAGCDCVKVEVDRRLASVVEAMAAATIPVMAHLGLRPQSVQSVGGYRLQGKRAADAYSIIEDAKIMEEAGAVALLLEAVPSDVADIISGSTDLPVTGICSGPHCDGQVLVVHDMLGFDAGHPPRSAKRYASIHEILVEAFRNYANDVAGGVFPAEPNSIPMDSAELDELKRLLARDRVS